MRLKKSPINLVDSVDTLAIADAFAIRRIRHDDTAFLVEIRCLRVIWYLRSQTCAAGAVYILTFSALCRVQCHRCCGAAIVPAGILVLAAYRGKLCRDIVTAEHNSFVNAGFLCVLLCRFDGFRVEI